jgi:hypothetical protein
MKKINLRPEAAPDKGRQWQKHLESWQQSGISQQKYCEQAGIKKSSFQYWRKKLDAPVGSAGNFIELKIKPLKQKSYIEIILPNRYRIRFSGDLQLEEIKNVLKIAGGM